MEQVTDNVTKTFKCLIVDDSKFARQSVAKIVYSCGGEVVGQAGNGFEAIDLYFSLQPDLVLLDITMPELDGIETLQRIMEKDENAKVIIVSAQGYKKMVWKAVCLGAKHYITKPLDADYASMIIKSVIDDGKGTEKCAMRT
jgi:two-component system chemotaxis response regulator CheY